MSTTITLHPSTQRAISYTLLHHRNSVFPTTSTSSSTPPVPIFPEKLLKSLQSLASPPPLFSTRPKTNIHPTLSLYISDLFSAARLHPQLDGTFLTVRARQDVESLVRAGRIIGGDLTGVEFITTIGKGAEANLEKNNNVEKIVKDGDAESLDIRLDEESINGSPNKISNPYEAYSNPDETLDVSEADIARIIPRVMSHRLRVRDGAEDEILGSLMHSAVGSCTECERGKVGDEEEKRNARPTVKDILVKILAEV